VHRWQELFNWKDVAIVVHSSKVARLGAALEKANEKEMRNAVRHSSLLHEPSSSLSDLDTVFPNGFTPLHQDQLSVVLSLACKCASM